MPFSGGRSRKLCCVVPNSYYPKHRNESEAFPEGLDSCTQAEQSCDIVAHRGHANAAKTGRYRDTGSDELLVYSRTPLIMWNSTEKI